MLDFDDEAEAIDKVDDRARALYLAMLEALLTGGGFEAVAAIAAEAVQAPVEVLVPRRGSEGFSGTPAERFVARLVAGDPGDPPREALAVTPIIAGDTIHGAVVVHGKGGPGTEVVLRTAAVAALTGVAILDARDGAAPQSGDSLLTDLLTGARLLPDEVMRRARERGCDLAAGAVGLAVMPLLTSAGEATAMIRAECPQALIATHEGRVFALLPRPDRAAEKLRDRLAGHSSVAVSSHYEHAGQLGRALEEAGLLLDVGAGDGPAGSQAAAATAYGLLFRLSSGQSNVLARFCEETIGSLVAYDEEQGAELLATLRSYQLHNCNMNRTAKATYTHRHTVANRLARIQELTGFDPLAAEDRQLLALALKSHRIVQRSGT